MKMTTDKISFVLPCDERFATVLSSLSPKERKAADEIIDHYLSVECGDISFAFTVAFGTLIVRVFNGSRYSFIFPYEISEAADMRAAIACAVRYAVLEEIEPVFEDVPREMVELFFQMGFRHINSDSDLPETDTYRITLKNECSLIEEYPSASDGELSLSHMTDGDASEYERLVKDEQNNKYWGYDYREDYPDCAGQFFVSLSHRDFELGLVLSLAIRHNGRFIGEALIASFDYKGGADISIRILPEHQNKGYAGRAFGLLRKIAGQMGLVTLYARVYKENKPSVFLFSKDADEEREEDGTIVFSYRLI